MAYTCSETMSSECPSRAATCKGGPAEGLPVGTVKHCR
jgi:hypothetical protein